MLLLSLLSWLLKLSNVYLIAVCFAICQDISRCVCQRNTDGPNCEKCLPLFNMRPYRTREACEGNDILLLVLFTYTCKFVNLLKTEFTYIVQCTCTHLQPKTSNHVSAISSKWVYCTFQIHMNSEVQKPTDVCIFRCCQSS